MIHTADWSQRITLRDGRQVTLRLVRSGDKPLFERGIHRLSEASRYRRFFSAKSGFSIVELRYLTEFDGVNHLAIGAIGTDPDGSEVGLGVARFVRLPQRPETAEAAIVVLDEVQNLGLGRALLQHIAQAAGERGIRHLQGEMLAQNAPVRQLLGQLAPGMRITHGDEDENLVVVEVDVEATGGPSGGALYRALKLAAEGLLSLARVLEEIAHGVAPEPDEEQR